MSIVQCVNCNMCFDVIHTDIKMTFNVLHLMFKNTKPRNMYFADGMVHLICRAQPGVLVVAAILLAVVHRML